MAPHHKLLEKRKHSRPTDEDAESVFSFLDHYFAWWRSKKSGSHTVVMRDSRLKDHPSFRGTLSIPISNGRKVKGVYLRKIVKAIDWIDSEGL